jgi:DNA-binding CsgD family transcriptional regulator
MAWRVNPAFPLLPNHLLEITCGVDNLSYPRAMHHRLFDSMRWNHAYSADDWHEKLLAVHGAESSVVLHAVDQLPMIAEDSLAKSYSYEFMEQSYLHNPATAYLMANPGVPMLTTREQLPSGDAIYAHPFYEHGIFRHEGQPDFIREEENALLSLHPHFRIQFLFPREGASDATHYPHLLTHSERAVVALASSCLDNQQISDRLQISLAAVKTRLHKAFKKLGVEHRSQLVNLLRTNGR